MPTPTDPAAERVAELISTAHQRLAETGDLLLAVARQTGQLEAALQAAHAAQITKAAPLLRAVFAWLEAERDDSDRSERAIWQDRIHDLGMAMAILRLPLTEE